MSGEPDNVIAGVREAPEFFVDGFRGVMTNSQTVKLNFFRNRLDAGTEETVKVAAFTMVISMGDFVAIAQTLPKLLAEFQEKGLVTVISSVEGANS